SNCGQKKDSLSLSERTFNCENCGFSIDRDLNAATNLVNLAVSSTVSACGLDSADTTRLKQEVNVKPA
ncbi:MAG: zinc ribbon domain-containing protein, partial [Jaaginema sp. PMC 1078.18]|nr:zinc ribbon domain-containing protein [Jaaginema sp. PMC 1078.18]